MSNHFRKAFAFLAVPIWLALSVPLMFFALVASAFLPRLVSLLLFFGPQYLFSFRHVVTAVPGGYEPLFQPEVAPVICTTFWVAVSIGYGFIARRWPAWRTFLVGLVVVVLAALALHAGFAVLGYGIELDGP